MPRIPVRVGGSALRGRLRAADLILYPASSQLYLYEHPAPAHNGMKESAAVAVLTRDADLLLAGVCLAAPGHCHRAACALQRGAARPCARASTPCKSMARRPGNAGIGLRTTLEAPLQQSLLQGLAFASAAVRILQKQCWWRVGSFSCSPLDSAPDYLQTLPAISANLEKMDARHVKPALHILSWGATAPLQRHLSLEASRPESTSSGKGKAGTSSGVAPSCGSLHLQPRSRPMQHRTPRRGLQRPYPGPVQGPDHSVHCRVIRSHSRLGGLGSV